MNLPVIKAVRAIQKRSRNANDQDYSKTCAFIQDGRRVLNRESHCGDLLILRKCFFFLFFVIIWESSKNASTFTEVSLKGKEICSDDTP